MTASYSKGAPYRTEVDEDKIAMVCKYLIYRLQGAREDILRYCDVKAHCKTIWNYTNGTLKGDSFLKDTGCLECIGQKFYVAVTNNITQSGGYYELQCNGVVERVTKESLRKISEGLTTTPGLLSCAEGLTTTPGLLSCAEGLTPTAGLLLCVEGLTTTAGSTLAVPPTTGVGSILCAVWAAYCAPIIIGLVVIGLLVIAVFARKRWNQNRRLKMQDLGLESGTACAINQL